MASLPRCATCSCTAPDRRAAQALAIEAIWRRRWSSAFKFWAFTRAAISNDPKENPPEGGLFNSGLMIVAMVPKKILQNQNLDLMFYRA